MMQVDRYIHIGNLLNEALTGETKRVSILQRITTFVKGMVSQFVRPSRAPIQYIVYT